LSLAFSVSDFPGYWTAHRVEPDRKVCWPLREGGWYAEREGKGQNFYHLRLPKKIILGYLNYVRCHPVQRTLLISLKVIGVVFITLLVVFLATGDELVFHFGTTALVLLASVICFFAKTLPVRAQALAFLFLTVGVSHAVDRYFWVGVWDQGYPWPYSHGGDCSSCAGSIGSISPFMNEVATLCFSVLATVAVIASAWHLTRHLRGRAASSAL
jgi:hypothetical protein